MKNPIDLFKWLLLAVRDLSIYVAITIAGLVIVATFATYTFEPLVLLMLVLPITAVGDWIIRKLATNKV